MTPAKNISKTGDWGDALFFQTVCDCTDPDHGHGIMVEVDEDGYNVTTSIYQSLEWAQWRNCEEPGMFVRIWRRLKNATKYLFTGYVKVEGYHLFQEEGALDYANALIEATNELKRRRKLFLMRAQAGNGERGLAPLSSQDVQGQGDNQAPQDLSP
jgi:hypothetical protein